MTASARWKTQGRSPGARGAQSRGIRGFERNYDSNMQTFRNCDVKRFETQTGDIRSPLTVSHSCATFVVNLRKEV